jgi:hypothetical protein
VNVAPKECVGESRIWTEECACSRTPDGGVDFVSVFGKHILFSVHGYKALQGHGWYSINGHMSPRCRGLQGLPICVGDVHFMIRDVPRFTSFYTFYISHFINNI